MTIEGLTIYSCSIPKGVNCDLERDKPAIFGLRGVFLGGRLISGFCTDTGYRQGQIWTDRDGYT